MYGIDKKAMYLMAKNNEVFNSQELCVQAHWPHIVGRVRKFSCTESQEALRQEWTEGKKDGVQMVQSQTHRVYVELVGTLEDVRKDRIEQYAKMPIREYVREVLEGMCAWVVSQIKDGQKYAYRWDTEIVPDDYFEKMRKAKKQEKKVLL